VYRVRFLTNIPTPYRNHQFRALFTAFRDRGTEIDFSVWYIHAWDKQRPWRLSSPDMEYPHRFLSPDSGRTCRATLELLQLLTRERPDFVIVGGYFLLPMQIAGVLCRLGLLQGALYCENHSPFRGGAARQALRRFFFRCFGIYVVPGARQEEYVRLQAGHQRVVVHRMPNLVDQQLFDRDITLRSRSRSKIRLDLGIADDIRILACVSRLEAIKGIDLLTEATASLPDNCVILVAGEGRLRGAIEASFAYRLGKIRLLGQCTADQIMDLLVAADAFILPSRNDAYPLAAIEAAWAGLPLLLSEKVGNTADLVHAGINGWLFDPTQRTALTSTLLKVSTMPIEDLRQMGINSHALAYSRFDTVRVSDACAEFVAGQLCRA
jgi:glycosyltransferase involved in cell wall biosynthesis